MSNHFDHDLLMGDTEIVMTDGTNQKFIQSGTHLNDLSREISADNRAKGFYEDDDFMNQIADTLSDTDTYEKFLQIWHRNRQLARIALIHSELSEAVEGIRKNAMDDHLPLRAMEEVELADATIRILDMAGCYGYDIQGAITEKLAYNRSRPYKHGKTV